LSLQPVLDPCITGSPQQAVVDGFFMMLKPLEPGQHTIVVHGTNTFGHDKTFTYNLTIE
jgi:isopentenyl phosphate kinase